MDWKDKSVVLFAVTISMLIVPIIFVPLRCCVRVSRRAFGIDDCLMVGALLFHSGACAIVLWGVFYGLGMKDGCLTEEDSIKGTQAFAIFKLLYVVTNCLIKCSICFTYLRLVMDRKIKIALYCILGTVSISSLVMFICSFLYCVPYSSIWTHWKHLHTPGHCLSGNAVLSMAYIFAATTLITDLCCAVIPGLILWNSRLKKGAKIMAYMILSLGILAGLITVCRLPYITYWIHSRNRTYGLGQIILFEIVECGLGILAICAPVLTPLLHQITSHWTSIDRSYETMEKAPSQQSSLPQLHLVIPDIEDMVVDGTITLGIQIPVSLFQDVRWGSDASCYTKGWDIV